MDSTDNFVEYGTALEPIEEDEVPSKKPVSVQDQIAVDDQGRRRFHGAFTGGFSAGYYNTVGSKEGWTPSEFKSSRQSKSQQSSTKAQNVQDFMDDEDIGAFGIAPQILRATNDFEQRESRKRTRPTAESASTGPIPGVPVLERIIQPVKETIGIRILQRMGWKPGQGVGPRLSKEERKLEREKRKDKKAAKGIKSVLIQQEDQPMVEGEVSDSKVYGCFLPPELRKPKSTVDSDSDESIIDLENVTFAPEDFEDPLCNPKENTFGLGYSGLDRGALSFGPVDLFGGSGIQTRVENRKLNIRGEAFGIGAFEDEDEEVYSRSDMSQYDFSLETPEERKLRRGKERHAKNQKANEKNKETGIIEGFVRAKNPPFLRKYFTPPRLPKDFEPKHYVRKSRFDKPPPALTIEIEKKKLGLNRHVLTIEDRQILLGEEKIPMTPQELEEIETKKKEEAERAKKEEAKEKAERLKKFTDVLQAFSSNKQPATLQSNSSAAAFKPFMKNPEKQDRYEKYMTLTAAGFSECLKDLQPLDMTEWERERERMEFERASALYKPMGGIMSSRFVSAKSHDISHVVPTREVHQEKDPSQDPKVAAKMNLFGKLTHKNYEWHPDRLLSKRFNVPHPHPESKMVGIRRDSPATTNLPSNSTADNTLSSGALAPSQSKTIIQTPAKKSLFDNIDFSKPPPGLLPQPIANISSEEGICPPGTEDEQTLSKTQDDANVKLEAETSSVPEVKPSIDLFKEIFENSSSESDEEEPEPQKPIPSKASRFFESSEKQNLSKIGKDNHINSRESSRKNENPKLKGVFDNLDFSKLERSKSKENTRDKESEERKKVNSIKESEDEKEDLYGPLPPSHPIPKKSSVSKDITKAPSRLSKESRENPISLHPFTQKVSLKTEDEEDVVWVEKKDLEYEERKNSKKSSEDYKTNKKHKKKKLKDKTHTHISKSKKSKKSKDAKRKKSKSKKSERKHYLSNSKIKSSEEEKDSSSSSSSDSDSDVRIHQSVSNKALLSKLKELTRSK